MAWAVAAIAIAACSSPDGGPPSPAADASTDDHNDSFDDAVPVVVDGNWVYCTVYVELP